MFNPLSTKNLWVSPIASENGDGTIETPFNTITAALAKAQRGSVVVLLAGTYEETVTIQELHGNEDNPITICAFPNSEQPIIAESEWYLYNVTDIIISGIQFQKTAHSAISLVGNSLRNSIRHCQFDHCGLDNGCSIFLGGSGGFCTVIENCHFTGDPKAIEHIDIMISQSIDSDDDDSTISEHTMIRYNHFSNCGTAIVMGSTDELDLCGNHQIDENLFENCHEGIRVKTRGATICGNIFRSCQWGINLQAGNDTVINDNRFENCTHSAQIFWGDVTFRDNCCVNAPISIPHEQTDTSAMIIHNNSFISTTNDTAPLLVVTNNIPLLISDNIFAHAPISIPVTALVSGNITTILTNSTTGITYEDLTFTDPNGGDFSHTFTVGCTHGAQVRQDIAHIPQVTIDELAQQFHHEHSNDTLSSQSIDEREIYLQSFFHQDENEGVEEAVNEDDEDDIPTDPFTLRAIGIDGELEDN